MSTSDSGVRSSMRGACFAMPRLRSWAPALINCLAPAMLLLKISTLASAQVGPARVPVSFKEYALPVTGSTPTGIASGSDGALWFTEAGANKIGRITTTGVIAEFVIPTAGSNPQGIASGPDGALWFTEFGGN